MPKLINILIEHMLPSDTPDESSFDFERWGNLMVQALFRDEGGWGRPSKSFLLYISPGGIIRGIKNSSHISSSDYPFKEGMQVNLSDLIGFENNSRFDLRMKGRIRESKLKEEKNKTIHPLLTYMENMRPHDDLLDDYIKLRVYFKNEGYSQEDLKSVKRAPGWVWEIQSKIPLKVVMLKQDLKKLGLMSTNNYIFEEEEKILMDYLENEMKKIDNQFPLNPPDASYVPPIMKDPNHSI
jgi:hypothetical protein